MWYLVNVYKKCRNTWNLLIKTITNTNNMDIRRGKADKSTYIFFFK